MLTKQKDDPAREVLLKEYDHVSQSVRNLFLATEKSMGLGVALTTVGLAIGLKEKLYESLMLLPIVFAAALLYALYLTTELRAIAGYKKHLEEKINEMHGEELLLWETQIAKSRHRLWGQKVFYFVGVVLFLISVYASLDTARQHYSLPVFISLIVIEIVLAAGLLISVIEMFKSFGLTYEVAKSRVIRHELQIIEGRDTNKELPNNNPAPNNSFNRTRN